jgi:voltage-dependent anion channel protein 2
MTFFSRLVQSHLGRLEFFLTVYLWLQAEFQYLYDYAGISASIGLNSKPLVNLSDVFGNKAVAVGADVAYDTATGNFTKYNAGLSVTNADLIAAVAL